MAQSTRAAQGYQDILAGPMSRIAYGAKIMKRSIERDWLWEIVSSSLLDDLLECNQIVQFTRAPKTGDWRTLDRNEEMIPDQLSSESFTITICNNIYKALKIDEQTIIAACSRWSEWEDAFLEDMYNNLAAHWRNYVVDSMILEADRANVGVTAGLDGDINLGAPGAPVQVTPQNFLVELANIRRVLSDQQQWVDGDMFVILPSSISPLLVETKLMDSGFMGDCTTCSPLVKGVMPNQILGFNVITSIHTKSAIDVNNVRAYYIVAGNSNAYAFTGNIVDSRIVPQTRAWGLEYQALASYGGAAMYPEGLSVAYWTISK